MELTSLIHLESKEATVEFNLLIPFYSVVKANKIFLDIFNDLSFGI